MDYHAQHRLGLLFDASTTLQPSLVALELLDMKRVLILDDEKEICFLLAALLTKMGYSADIAYTLEEGFVKIAEEQAFDVVFLDLNLPDGLGYKIVPDIKGNDQHTKVVMISAHDGMLKKIGAETPGIDYIITKPFNRTSITEALSQLDA